MHAYPFSLWLPNFWFAPQNRKEKKRKKEKGEQDAPGRSLMNMLVPAAKYTLLQSFWLSFFSWVFQDPPCD
jgi:hypothetical protein